MAFAPGSSQGAAVWTGGFTTLIAAPVGGKRLVKTITVYNSDVAPLQFIVQLYVAGLPYIITQVILQPGETWVFGDRGETLVLDTTKDVLAYIPTGIPTTNAIHHTAHWADYT